MVCGSCFQRYSMNTYLLLYINQNLQKSKCCTSSLGLDVCEALYNLGIAATTVSATGHDLQCVNTCLNF